MTFKLRSYQRTAIDAIKRDWQDGYRDVLLTAATGSGKAQPVDEPVLTPTGWTCIGDLQVGRAIIGSDGLPHRVIGIYPQGNKQVFCVTFSDGTTVRCCDDHLWAVRTSKDKDRGRGYRVLPLSSIRRDYLNKHGYGKWFLPIVKPIQFEERPVPIDPYALGYLIGNGCLTNCSITFSTAEDDVLERFRQTFPDYLIHCAGGYDYRITQGDSKGPGPAPLTDALRHLGLWGKVSYEKFIPSFYKYNAVKIRLDLLRGLMDADGNVHRDSGEFNTSSPQLAEDVAELVRSLGGVTAVRVKKHVTYPYNGETRCGRDGYRVTVSLPHINPFWCARKASGYDPRPKRAADCKSIVAIEPDGERPCVCIAVDSVDQLYVTTGYTLTHNTCIFLQLLDEVLQDGQRALILAHRRELVMQPYERLGQFWPQRQQRAGIVMAQTNEAWAQIVIATVQTLQSEKRLAQILRSGPIDYLVVDESHHCPSPSYRRIIAALKHVNPNLRHVGVTATPIRADEVGLRTVYQKESAHFGIKELVKLGYLAPPRWLAIQTGISLAGIRSQGSGADRDFNQKQLANVYETANCFELVVETHKRYAADRQSVAFTVSVDGAYELAETFNRAGVPAAAADGTTPNDERQQLLNDFRAGKYQVLCNVGLYVEGLDLPEISCVHMVRPTQSDSLYTQCVGRALRLFPGKQDALILDYAPLDSRNIAMLGDVLGVEAKKETYVQKKDDPGAVVAGFTFDGNVQWLAGNPMEIVSRQLDYLNATPWRWSRPSGKTGPMVLGLGPGSDDIDRTLIISPPAEQMDVWLVAKRAGERWHRAYHVMSGTFEQCSEWANAYADERGNAVLARKQAAWRNSLPSEGQVKFARRLGVYRDGMSKGEVADAITCKLALDALRRKGAAA